MYRTQAQQLPIQYQSFLQIQLTSLELTVAGIGKLDLILVLYLQDVISQIHFRALMHPATILLTDL